MPINAQDLWVVLKAQDMATRALNAYSRSVRKAGSETRSAYVEAAQGALQNELAAKRLAQSYERTAIRALEDEKATNRLTLAQKTQLGLSQAQVDAIKQRNTAITGEINARNRSITALDNDTNAIRRNILAMDRETERIKIANAKLADHQAKIMETSAKYKAFSQSMYTASFTITALGVVGASALKSAINAATDYETQVRKTFTQVDKGKTSLKELGDIGVKIATNIGIKFEDVQAALYDVFSSMDVSVQDATKYVELFAKAAVAGQTDISSVSRGTIAILNSFKLSAGDLNHVLDLQFEFIRKGVGTYDEWVTKLGAVAPSAIRAGQSLETMFAALAEASRMSGVAAKAATSVARALDVISHPKAIAAMKALGINALDASGNLRPLADVLTDIKTRIDKIPGGRNEHIKAFLDIIKGAGGTIEARRFLTNMIVQEGTLEDFKNILKDTANASGALNQAYGIMADNTQTKTQLLKNRFHALWMEVGTGLIPYFNKLLDIGNAVARWLGNLSPKTKEMASKFLAWATAAALIVGPILGILGIIGSLSAALAALGLGIGEVILIIVGIGLAIAYTIVYFKKAWQSSEAFREMLIQLWHTAQECWQVLKKFGEDIADSFKKNLLPALTELWQAFNDKIMPIIRDLVTLYASNLKPNLEDLLEKLKWVADKGFKYISEAIRNWLIPAFTEVKKFYDEHQATIDKVITAFQTFAKWVAIIVGGTVFGALIAGIVVVIGVFALLVVAAIAVIDFWEMMSRKAIELTHWIGKKFHEMVGFAEFLYNGIKDWLKKAFEAVAKFAQDWFDKFKDAAGKMYDIGKNIVTGLINGLEAIWPALENKLKELASHLPKPVRDALGIGSPSKVFAQLGKYTVQGYIKGMTSMEGPLGKAVNRMSSTMLGGKYANADYVGAYNSGYAATSGNNNSRSSNVTVQVSTNEIRPEYHATRLGHLLAGRVGG